MPSSSRPGTARPASLPPLPSTNAIAAPSSRRTVRPSSVTAMRARSTRIGAAAAGLSAVNISGGFLVTKKMLDMFKRPDDPEEHYGLYAIPAGAMLTGLGTGCAAGMEHVPAAVAVASGVCCIGGIAGLSSQETARMGNVLGMSGVAFGVSSAGTRSRAFAASSSSSSCSARSSRRDVRFSASSAAAAEAASRSASNRCARSSPNSVSIVEQRCSSVPKASTMRFKALPTIVGTGLVSSCRMRTSSCCRAASICASSCALRPAAMAPAMVLARAGACSVDLDCSLNGLCVDAACACDAGWRGDACQTLALGAAPAGGAYGFAPNVSAWGSHVLRGADGLYHMFVSEMWNACGINSWQTNSHLVHATAPTPLGPYAGGSVVSRTHRKITEIPPAIEAEFRTVAAKFKFSYDDMCVSDVSIPSCTD